MNNKIQELVVTKAKDKKQYIGRPDWWTDNVERAGKRYMKQKTMLYRNKIETIKRSNDRKEDSI